jgi:hypothetical protein
MIRNIEETTHQRIETILTLIKSDVINYLRGYTNLLKPPREYEAKYMITKEGVRVKKPVTHEGWRPMHPGGWADVTFDLMKQYYTQLDEIPGGWKLTIGNRSEHARYVEGRDGMFVVTGVMAPNGPVDRAIRLAFKRLAKGATVINGNTGAIFGLEPYGTP